MRYTPDWERLADALRRVMATGATEGDAKADLCRAAAEGKIHVRVTIDPADPDYGGRTLSHRHVEVPPHLAAEDLNWDQSRPHQRWNVGPDELNPAERYFSMATWKSRSIVLIELATADVQSVFSMSEPKPDPAAGEANFNQPPSEGGGSDLELDSSVNDRSSRTRKMPPMPDKPGHRREAWNALKIKYPDGLIPNDHSGAFLHKIVNHHIAQLPRDAIEGRLRQTISLDTVLRAAGRKK